MKQFGVLLAVAALFVGLQSTTAHAKNDNLIVPGVRIGPVRIGMTDADLYKILGDPTQTLTTGSVDGGITYFWGNSLVVHVDKDTHRVVQVTTNNPKYSTADGIKVGSSGLAISTKLGIPAGNCQVRCDYYYPNRILLHINPNGSVGLITVYLHRN
jgi:hypothetical protein